MTILEGVLIWAGTMASMSIGFIFGKPWLDRRLNRKQQQPGGTKP